VQWDDYETRNNWYPGQIIGLDSYQVKSASLLSAYARQAMFEYNPMRFNAEDVERVYRRTAYGPALDVFVLAERSYRGPNSPNRQPTLNDEAAFSRGRPARLAQALAAGLGRYLELIASDMPISLVVLDLYR
jgi:alkaline phosphatase D